MNVLILDDREEDLAALDAIISARGHAVTRARNGEEGMGTLRKAAADLIICDAVMPGMDGVTMLKEVRRDQAMAAIPFYVTTAVMTGPEDEKFFFDLGASGVIRKPFDPRVIQKVLEDAAPGAGMLGLGVPPRRPMGDDTFIDRYTDRLVDRLEKMVIDLQSAMRSINDILDAVEQPVIVIGEDFRIVRANAAAARRLGSASAAELAGKSCYRTVYGSQTPCAFPGHACPLRQVIFEKKAVRHEAVLETPSIKGPHLIAFSACQARPDVKAALVEQIFDGMAPAAAPCGAVKPAGAARPAAKAAHDLKNSLTGILGFATALVEDLPPDGEPRKAAEAIVEIVKKASSPPVKADELPAGSPSAEVEVTPDATTISLPQVPAAEAGVIPGAAATRTPPVGTVLLVDDEETMLEVGKRILGKHRLNVITASDPFEATIIFEARRDEIDLVVLDIAMPGSDAAGTFDQLMAIDDTAKVLLAGPAGHANTDAIISKGAIGLLPKPYDAAALLQAVQDGLARPLPPEKAVRRSQVPRKARMRVLVVDDEEMVLRTLERSLCRNFDVVTLGSAEAAMELLGLDRDFDWIVADLNMRGKSGVDLYEYVREKAGPLAARFVLMTGGAAGLSLIEKARTLNLPSFEKPGQVEALRSHLKGESTPQ
ncbi:MAG: response regulator [Deltaproteobacteria bacterium]|nr:response regulator [Deltaproteobacteria bacterium]